jgi:hypothetical protein
VSDRQQNFFAVDAQCPLMHQNAAAAELLSKHDRGRQGDLEQSSAFHRGQFTFGQVGSFAFVDKLSW